MKTTYAAVAVSAGLLLAVLWGVAPPRHAPQEGAQQESRQCPANSRLEGQLCTCPEATSWTGTECMQVWSSSARGVAVVAPPPPRLTVSGGGAAAAGQDAVQY